MKRSDRVKTQSYKDAVAEWAERRGLTTDRSNINLYAVRKKLRLESKVENAQDLKV